MIKSEAIKELETLRQNVVEMEAFEVEDRADVPSEKPRKRE
jgi:hypothetical protein